MCFGILILILVPIGIVLSYIGIIIGLFSYSSCGPSTINGFAGALITYMLLGSLLLFYALVQLGTWYYKWKN